MKERAASRKSFLLFPTCGTKKEARDILQEMNDPTPLLCELVCCIVNKDLEVGNNETVTYEKVVERFWIRFQKKKSMKKLFGKTMLETIADASHQLQRLSLEALLG